jgi:hypothetical protein
MRAACPECEEVIEPVLIERLPAREPASPNAINACSRVSARSFTAAVTAPNMPVVPGL